MRGDQEPGVSQGLRSECGFQQRLDVPGQQGLEFSERGGSRQLLKQIGQVRVRIHAVRATGSDDAVEICAGGRAVLSVHEQPCPSSDGKWADVIFNPVVVSADLGMIEEPR